MLATARTVRSAKYQALLKRTVLPELEIKVQSIACIGLAERIDVGEVDSPETIALINTYLEPVKNSDVDVVVLGCTHYVFIRREVSHLIGDDVPVVDGNAGTARQVKAVLQREGLLRSGDLMPFDNPTELQNRVTIFASANADKTIPLCKQYLARELGLGA